MTTKSKDDTERSVRQELQRVDGLSPRRLQALRAAVTDAGTEIGANAALQRLADHGTRSAVDAIRAAVDDRRMGVRAEAALLLGRLGAEEDYERIAKIRSRSTVPKRKLQFGRALLGHRHGELRETARLTEVNTADRKGLALEPIDTRRPDDGGTVGAEAPTEAFGVALADDPGQSGVELLCGENSTLVLPTEHAVSAPAEVLMAKPFVLAVGSSRAQETDGWSHDWVALATPERATKEATVAIRVFSSSGRLQLAGRGRMVEEGIEYEVLPIAGARGPRLSLLGTVSAGRLRITEAGRAVRAEGGKAPQPD